MKTILTSLILLSLAANTYARQNPEKFYQNAWCAEAGGQVEYVLPDKTRVDCLTRTHAIVFDFANKWAEALGQALYYAKETNRKAGIALIMERPSNDLKYVVRLVNTINYYGLNVQIWLVQ